MAGLLLIVLVIGYAAITIVLLLYVRPWWGKLVVLIVAALVPTADDMYYRRQLAVFCRTQAGFHVYETASGQAVLLDERAVLLDYLTDKPLMFAESYDKATGKYVRLIREGGGVVNKIFVDSPASTYEFNRNEQHYGAFVQTEAMIRHRESGRLMADIKGLNYYGGWWRRVVLGSLADSGPTLVANCGNGNPPSNWNDLINRVFTKSDLRSEK